MTTDSRLFTGLSLPPEMLVTMEALLEELEPLAPRIRWSRSYNLHITTRFIGKWPSVMVPTLARILHSMDQPARFPVTVTGLRFRQNPDRSWLLYAHVEPCDGLTELACNLDSYLRFHGIEPETREYSPHITIGRIPGANPWPLLDQKVEEYSSRPFGSFEAKEYHLYESVPSGYYRPVTTVPLPDVSSTL